MNQEQRDLDLESQKSSIRSRGLCKLTGAEDHEQDSFDEKSLGSSAKTPYFVLLTLVVTATTDRAVDSKSAITQPPDFSPAHTEFLDAISGGDLEFGVFKDARDWYLKYMDHQIQVFWVDIFRPVLLKVDPDKNTPCPEDLDAAYHSLGIIIGSLKEKKLALVDIVNTLYKKGVLKDTDGGQTHATRLAFVTFGWMTLLYQPNPRPDTGCLSILHFDNSNPRPRQRGSKRRPQLPNSRVVTSNSQDIESFDQPFPTFLANFGKIMPQHNRQIFGGLTTPGRLFSQLEEWLEVPMLCFYTLHKVTSIKIQWVESLALHLEFDSQSRILKLFKYPSLCLIMACNDRCCLSQLFSDAANETGYPGIGHDDAGDYFKEVLLSYRLIFGQDKNSWPLYKQSRPRDSESHDPLLDILCGQSWDCEDARLVWNEIGAEDPSDRYNLTDDYTFLSKRLIVIQKFVKGHNPRGFLSLWYDCRYPLQWWNLWAVIIIGLAALFFTLLQAALQIFQLYYAKIQAECNP